MIDGFVAAFTSFDKKKSISSAHLNKVQNEIENMEEFLREIKEKLLYQSKLIMETQLMRQIKQFEKNLNMYQGKQKIDYTQGPLPIIDELRNIQDVIKKSLQAIEALLIEYDLQRIRWTELLMDTKLCAAGQEKTIIEKVGNWLRSLSFKGLM